MCPERLAAADDVELLDLLLWRDGAQARPGLAASLIKVFGGFAAVLAADRAMLARDIPGAVIDRLKLVREAAQRVGRSSLERRDLLTAYSQVALYLRTAMAGLPREVFWVLFLDRANQLIASERLSEGTVDHAPVYPREVMRRALELNASAMILAHNHPSGDPTPSRPDIEMTKTLIAAAAALKITIHDHMIVGREGVASMRSMGLL